MKGAVQLLPKAIEDGRRPVIHWTQGRGGFRAAKVGMAGWLSAQERSCERPLVWIVAPRQRVAAPVQGHRRDRLQEMLHTHRPGSQISRGSSVRIGSGKALAAAMAAWRVPHGNWSARAMASYGFCQVASGSGNEAGTGWVFRNENVLSMAERRFVPLRGPALARSAMSGQSVTREFGRDLDMV